MNAPLDRFAVARLGSEPLLLGQVLRRSHADALRRLIEEAIRERIIERAIIEHDIRVHPQELARARALFAADHGLEDRTALDAWILERGLTRADLEDELRRIIAFGKLKDRVVGDRADRSAQRHCEVFEAWLDEQRRRLGVQLTYRELL